MLLKENYSNEYLGYLYDEYSEKYNDIIKGNIYEKLKIVLNDGLNHNEVPSEIAQMYHEYGLIREKLDYYSMFKDKLVKIYKDLSKRSIVDVGAGLVPQLSRELAKVSQKEVFAVDKHITSNNDFISNLILIQGEFNENTTLTSKDLLVGLHPCEATLDIVKKAAEYNIDFAIALCDCYKNNTSDKRFREWINLKNEIHDIVEDSDLGEVTFSKIGLSPLIYTNKNIRQIRYR